MRFLVRVSAPLSCSHEGMLLKESNPKASLSESGPVMSPKFPKLEVPFLESLECFLVHGLPAAKSPHAKNAQYCLGSYHPRRAVSGPGTLEA